MSNNTTALCPSLNNKTENPIIITIDTLKVLRLSSYNRSVGAVVEVSCLKSQKLYGSRTVTCLKNLTWTAEPNCGPPPPVPDVSTKHQLIIGLSTVGGFLILITIIGIIWSLLRKQKKEGDNYKHMQNKRPHDSIRSPRHGRHMQNGSFCNSANSLQFDGNRYPEINDAVFYGPKSYPPRSHSWSGLHLVDPVENISTKRNENIHMSPITLPQNKDKWEVMQSALPRLPSSTSLDAPTTSNFKKKRYDFEEFNVYALRQGRDPFLWRPVVSNMHFDS